MARFGGFAAIVFIACCNCRSAITSGIYGRPPQTLHGCDCKEPCSAADWFHCSGAEFCIVEKGSCINGSANTLSSFAEFDVCVYDADQNYEAKSASEKVALLLRHLDHHSSTAVEAMNKQLYSSGTLFERIVANDVRHVFEMVSDVFPKAEGRQQLREAGVIGTIEFISAGGHPYTGLFQGAEHGFVRFSIADSPSSFFQPSMGIKLLRDGRPSANLVAMARNAAWGQSCSIENFFHYDFSNHLPSAKGMHHAEVIVGKFSQASTCPLMVGLSDFASISAAAPVKPGSFPFQLVFKPVVNVTCNCAHYAVGACLGNLSALATGPLFQVLAQASPGADLQSIGQILLKSKLKPSSFGDSSYFHKHQRMEKDFAIQPQWLEEIDKEGNCGFRDASAQLPSVEGSCSRFNGKIQMRGDDTHMPHGYSPLKEVTGNELAILSECRSSIFKSEEEGIELVRQFFATFRKAFKTNDMAELQKMYADDVVWDWSGGVSGSCTNDELFKGPASAVGKAWGALISDFIPSRIFTVVDAASGETFTSFEVVLAVDGRGKLPISPSSLVLVRDVYELHFNNEKKVVYWKAFYNTLDRGMTKALANIFPLVYGMNAPPVPVAMITEGEANEWVKRFMEKAKNAFATNDMVELQSICAEEMAWDFSGGNKGMGTKAQFSNMLSKMWPSSAFIPTDIFTTVDAALGQIIVTFELMLNFDGHGTIPANPETISTFRSVFQFHLDAGGKLTALKGRWNSLDKDIAAKVSATKVVCT